MFDRALPCPHCRYDLRGITRSVCPECGRNVESYLRIADLSPGRIRRERLDRFVRRASGLLGVVVLLGPIVAVVLFLLLTWAP